MQDWLDGSAGPGYTSAILWTLLALALLVVVLVVVKLVRSLTFGTFVAGGRNRKTRLAVMDATAVDSHRRLVLVRRDDIEHLLLIGGPTDVVVERDIRMVPSRRPAPNADTTTPQQQVPAPVARPRPQQQPAVPVAQRPAPARPPQAAAPMHPVQQAEFEPRPAPQPQVTTQAYRVNPAPVRTPYPAAPAATIDDTLLRELEISLEEDEPATAAPAPRAAPSSSPDDEMAKLLGELSNHKK